MLGLNYETIVEKIKNSAKISQSEIDARVQQKMEQLSGLVSKEGAASIIANELGVKLYDPKPLGRLKIRELTAFNRNVEVLARVIRIYDIRTFKKDNREGRIASLFIGDETGQMRAVVWDEKIISEIEKSLKDSDVVLVKNAYVKENNGYRELHLGSNSAFTVNPLGETVPVKTLEPTKKDIKDLVPGENATITGFVVHIFDPAYYEACPDCNKKLALENNIYVCMQHGKVLPRTTPILNAIIDDTTEPIRVTFFRENAEQALGIDRDTLLRIKENKELLSEVKTNSMGRNLTISGRVIKNEMFNRVELTANNVNVTAPPKTVAEEIVR